MPAIPLDLTPEEIAYVLGYFSHPKVKTFIEIQVHPAKVNKVKTDYKQWTGQRLLDNARGYSELATTSNKQAPQLRIRFDLVGKMPQHLDPKMIKKGPSNKGPQRRISRIGLVKILLEHGFLVGDNSGPKFHATIRANNAKINPTCTQDFDDGYNDAY